jgi:hypothetical protein
MTSLRPVAPHQPLVGKAESFDDFGLGITDYTAARRCLSRSQPPIRMGHEG